MSLKNCYSTLIAVTLTLTLIMLVGTTGADGTQRRAELNFDQSEELKDLTGIFLTGVKAAQTKQVEMIRLDQQSQTVAMPLPASGNDPVYVLAAARNSKGEVVYSNVGQANPNTDLRSIYSLAACVDEAVDPNMQSQISLITNLVQVRAKRRANFQEKLNTHLTGEYLEKLKRYETGFGLQREAELNPNLPVSELVDRLNRILHTLRKISPGE